MFRTIFLLFAFIAPSVSNGFEITDQELYRLANDLSKHLPKRIDIITTATAVTALPSLELEYEYKVDKSLAIRAFARENNVTTDQYKSFLIDNFGSIDEFFKLVMARHSEVETNKLCSNKSDSVHNYLNAGVKIKHIFFDENGIYLASNTDTNKTCLTREYQ